MTQVLITIDTELSAGRQKARMPLQSNIDQSIFGKVSGGRYGVEWQMDQMERRGLKGAFFVDPMPGLVHGPDCVTQMVEPILRRGHGVQVHIHTEWLEWAKDSPVEGRQGHNIGDFTLTDQISLIGWARDALVAAGAPRPIAFRAGNFGANDDTLGALAQLGLRWDTSFNPDYAAGPCKISLTADAIDPIAVGEVIELPVAGIWDKPGHYRPAQVCALSEREMRLALMHAAKTDAPVFVAVTHSFEMLSRDRARLNHMVMKRFAALCDIIAAHQGLESSGFGDLDPKIAGARRTEASRLPSSRLRTLARMGEQAIATWRFERRRRFI